MQRFSAIQHLSIFAFFIADLCLQTEICIDSELDIFGSLRLLIYLETDR